MNLKKTCKNNLLILNLFFIFLHFFFPSAFPLYFLFLTFSSNFPEPNIRFMFFNFLFGVAIPFSISPVLMSISTPPYAKSHKMNINLSSTTSKWFVSELHEGNMQSLVKNLPSKIFLILLEIVDFCYSRKTWILSPIASLKSINSFPPNSSAASSNSSLMLTPPRAVERERSKFLVNHFED